MRGLTQEEKEYRHGQRALKYCVDKLQKVLKIRRLVWISKKAHNKNLETPPSEATFVSNGKRSHKTEKTSDWQELTMEVEQNTEKPEESAIPHSPAIGKINDSWGKREPPKVGRYKRIPDGKKEKSFSAPSGSRKKNPPEIPCEVGPKKTLELMGKTETRKRKSFEQDQWRLSKNITKIPVHIQGNKMDEKNRVKPKATDGKECANLFRDNDLNHVGEHPMLQRQLVAEINGSYIQFHLVDVDPQLLLRQNPVFTNEPMPSLIWPFD